MCKTLDIAEAISRAERIVEKEFGSQLPETGLNLSYSTEKLVPGLAEGIQPGQLVFQLHLTVECGPETSDAPVPA